MDIDKTITTAADKIIEAITKYGPQAADFAREVGRIGAIQEILTGLSCLLIAFMIFRFAARPLTNAIRAENHREWIDIDPAIMIGVAFSYLGMCGFLVAASSFLFNIFAWVGMWRPEIYLAAKMLKL